jgi:nuclear pore complex protein Nup107
MYDTASEQAKVILRYLGAHLLSHVFYDADVVRCVSSRKVVGVHLFLDILPHDVVGISMPEEHPAEYFDYLQFFVTRETVERVTECQALEAPK